MGGGGKAGVYEWEQVSREVAVFFEGCGEAACGWLAGVIVVIRARDAWRIVAPRSFPLVDRPRFFVTSLHSAAANRRGLGGWC